MGFAPKKRLIKFCPFCGSDQISHIESDVFFCGPRNLTEEGIRKLLLSGKKLCGRAFRVSNGITGRAGERRKQFNDIQQTLFRKGKLVPPRKGQNLT